MKNAVSEVLLSTVTRVTAIPVPLTETVVAPARKFVPLTVTGTVAPAIPAEGLTAETVGLGVEEGPVGALEQRASDTMATMPTTPRVA